MVNSLCPSADELDEAVARKLNFQPERQLSSNVFYRLEAGAIAAHYFSLEGHSPAKHNQLLRSLGLAETSATSLEILGSSLQLESATDLQAALDTVFGQQDVFSCDAEILLTVSSTYKALIQEIDRSLQAGRVSQALGNLATSCYLDLKPNQAYDHQQARSDLERLRSQILPHYVLNQHLATIATAGQEVATTPSIFYGGACPTSLVGDSAETATLGWAHSQLLIRQARELLERKAGEGRCQSCSSVGQLYGCGAFCYSCNRHWCQAYRQTGKQLSSGQIRRQTSS